MQEQYVLYIMIVQLVKNDGFITSYTPLLCRM